LRLKKGGRPAAANLNHLGGLYTYGKGTFAKTEGFEDALAELKPVFRGAGNVAIEKAGKAWAWLRWKAENKQEGAKPPADIRGIMDFFPAFDSFHKAVERKISSRASVMPPEVEKLGPEEQKIWQEVKTALAAKKITPHGASRLFKDRVGKLRARA